MASSKRKQLKNSWALLCLIPDNWCILLSTIETAVPSKSLVRKRAPSDEGFHSFPLSTLGGSLHTPTDLLKTSPTKTPAPPSSACPSYRPPCADAPLPLSIHPPSHPPPLPSGPHPNVTSSRKPSQLHREHPESQPPLLEGFMDQPFCWLSNPREHRLGRFSWISIRQCPMDTCFSKEV